MHEQLLVLANKFHTLGVKSIVKTTASCSIVSFEVPEALEETFSFIQGQYLTLKAEINGEEVRRSYSLCSSPLDKEWKVGIKKIPGGLFSTFANDQLKTGDTLEVMPPNGKFYVEVNPSADKNFVAFAAGSGITPILSIIKTHLQSEPKAKFKLFYTNQTVASIILKEELEALKNSYMDRLELFYFLTKEKRNIPFFNGRMDVEKLSTIFNSIIPVNQVDEVFSCGPEAMIFCVRDFLTDKGMDTNKIHFELFTTGQSKDNKTTIAKPEFVGKMSEIHIREGGKDIIFSIPTGSNNVLDGGLNNNADLPFACKGGVCCTCRAKLIEGEVEMKINYALEQEEIDQGYVLTCQAVPLTDKVVVDFDA